MKKLPKKMEEAKKKWTFNTFVIEIFFVFAVSL